MVVKISIKKNSHTLEPPTQLGLSRIDIPDSSATNWRFGDPSTPKSWSGPWRSIAHPTEIAQIVKIMNITQYHQAFSTPFGSGPLAQAIGRNAESLQSTQLLAGQMCNLPLESLLPETVQILHTLDSSHPTLHPKQTPEISESEFISAYKCLREDTSSSPSGRHVGHYKSILDDLNLVNLHAMMMSIPFAQGFVPTRWTKVTDIMLQKEANNSRCHRLQVIALFKSDLNQAKCILIGCKLSHHLEDNKLLPSMQFGSRPGQECQSAVLHKVISHGISRLTKRPPAHIENDAVGCYDQMINSLILLLLLKLGFPTSISKCLSSLWDNTTHFIKTLYGTSSITYCSTASTPLFSPGQGSTTGPPFWLLLFFAITTSMDPSLAHAAYQSICRSIQVRSTGTASLSVSSTYTWNNQLSTTENSRREVSQVVEHLGSLAQHWERLLFSTGGAINMQKSHWYLLSWIWRSGKSTLCTIANTPAELKLTTGYSASPVAVPRIDPHTAYRTLGVYISPSGLQAQQLKHLREHSVKYYSAISTSSLTPAEVFLSYTLYLIPKLLYPLACTSLTEKQCRFIQAPALAALLPKLQLNRHTPHAVLFGNPKYGGLGLPDLYTDQGFQQLRFFLGHLYLDDDIGKLILIAISHLQLHLGVEHKCLTCPFPPFAKWIDHWWLTSIWKHMHQLKITVNIEHHWAPKKYREQDIFLMDYAMQLHLSTAQIRGINQCRLYLQVLTISDISTVEGRHLHPNILSNKPLYRTSTLQWPFQANPPKSGWRMWRVSSNTSTEVANCYNL